MYRPTPVFAVQLTRENRDELRSHGIPHQCGLIVENKYGNIVICKYGDYLIKDHLDDHSVLSAEDFEASYARV